MNHDFYSFPNVDRSSFYAMNKLTPSIYVSEYRLQEVDTVTCIFDKVQTRETGLKLSFEKLFGFFGISFTKEYFDRLEI